MEYSLTISPKRYHMKQQPLRILNTAMTNWVISLHQIGYTDDFLPLNSREVQCVQNGESFAIKDLRFNLIDCNYDLLTRSYQYIHTIDTGVGYRGLLITNGILGLNN
jgi:hypothetical protein